MWHFFYELFTRDFAWLYLLAFIRPLTEAFMVTAGEWWFHTAFKTTDKYERLLIQITTTGKEFDRVQEIIQRIRSYNLPMDYRIWVVIEPNYKDGDGNVVRSREDYDADRVVVVHPLFKCLAIAKARAQQFAFEIRRDIKGDWGSYDEKLKLLNLDDDVEPTRAYIMTGFAGDYDICQGITAPRIHYGTHGFKHFLLGHMDDMRFLACFVWCSFTQGIIKRPVYAHGEGLFLTATAERKVTWNYKIFASEDLVVGQNAAALGLKWGWFHEYIELTSPWSWSDYLKQRRRWLWGNIHAIKTNGVLPTWGRILVASKYLLGFVTFGLSLLGVILLLTHKLHFTPMAYVFTWGSFISWTVSFFVTGWVNAGRRQPEDLRSDFRFGLWRFWQGIAAVLLAVTLVTPTWTTLALLIGFFKGNPRGFEVIRKTAVSTNTAA
jgi:hypothetical protein